MCGYRLSCGPDGQRNNSFPGGAVMRQSRIPTKWTPELRRPGHIANPPHSSNERGCTHNLPHVYVNKTIIKNRKNFTTFNLPHMGLFLVPKSVQRRIPRRRSSCEVNSYSCGQEIPHKLWNQKFYYRIHKRRSQAPPYRVMHPYTPIIYVFVISALILYFYLILCLRNDFSLSLSLSLIQVLQEISCSYSFPSLCASNAPFVPSLIVSI